MLVILAAIVNLFFPWGQGCPRAIQSAVLVERAVLERELAANSERTLEERIDFWSEAFLDVPYGVDPMGEFMLPDIDPVVEMCSVDCETYVELVMALSLARNVDGFLTWLDHTRYIDGVRRSEYRYYTMALHWIPGNLKLGYMKEVLIRPSSVVERRVFPSGRWLPVHLERFAELGKNAPRGLARVRYTSLNVLREQQHRIPTPSVAFLVGARQAGNPFLITHMGFILKDKKGRHIFRHASRTPGRMRVEERSLSSYLLSLQKHFNNPENPRRAVLGLSIHRLVEPPGMPEKAQGGAE